MEYVVIIAIVTFIVLFVLAVPYTKARLDNHQLKKEGRDNPTIGLLICKEKDKVQAQYALESSTQPIAISEYDLEKFYPEKIEGTIPTIEEIEKGLETH